VGVVAVASLAMRYPLVAMAVGALFLGLGVRAWARGLAAATRVIGLFHAQAQAMDLIECRDEAQPRASSAEACPGPPAAPGGDDHAPSAPGSAARGPFAPAFPSVVALEGPAQTRIEEEFA
jgi:hypothetical protein